MAKVFRDLPASGGESKDFDPILAVRSMSWATDSFDYSNDVSPDSSVANEEELFDTAVYVAGSLAIQDQPHTVKKADVTNEAFHFFEKPFFLAFDLLLPVPRKSGEAEVFQTKESNTMSAHIISKSMTTEDSDKESSEGTLFPSDKETTAKADKTDRCLDQATKSSSSPTIDKKTLGFNEIETSRSLRTIVEVIEEEEEEEEEAGGKVTTGPGKHGRCGLQDRGLESTRTFEEAPVKSISFGKFRKDTWRVEPTLSFEEASDKARSFFSENIHADSLASNPSFSWEASTDGETVSTTATEVESRDMTKFDRKYCARGRRSFADEIAECRTVDSSDDSISVNPGINSIGKTQASQEQKSPDKKKVRFLLCETSCEDDWEDHEDFLPFDCGRLHCIYQNEDDILFDENDPTPTCMMFAPMSTKELIQAE